MKADKIVPSREPAQSGIIIKRIDATSSFLEAVISLHSSDGQGLGMFPRGAFTEHAERKWILIAHDESESLLGYLLYREAKQRAMIAHLCVRRDCRLKGVGRALIEKLKSDTRHLRGLENAKTKTGQSRILHSRGRKRVSPAFCIVVGGSDESVLTQWAESLRVSSNLGRYEITPRFF